MARPAGRFEDPPSRSGPLAPPSRLCYKPAMSEVVEITVVGAGAVGAAVAAAAAAAGREVFVVEKNPGVTRGENQSSRNSGVLHAGLYYDRRTRPLKAALCARGNRLAYEFCQRHGVPALACGKLVVAIDDREIPTLELYLRRAAENGAPCQLLDARRAAEREPLVAARAALWLPTSGVVDPTALVHQLYANASRDGAQFLTGTRVSAAEPRTEGIEVTLTYPDGAEDRFLTRRLVNAAGLYADQVALMVNPASPYRIDPMRGEAMCFYRRARPDLALAGVNVYPTPRRVSLPGGVYWTVGVHLTPTLEPAPGGGARLGDTVTVGPLNFAAAGREDYGGDLLPAGRFQAEVAPFFPALCLEDLRPYQVGVQARLAGHQDWVIAPDPAEPRLVNLMGIDSPGLTSCLAIAERVRAILDQHQGRTA